MFFPLRLVIRLPPGWLPLRSTVRQGSASPIADDDAYADAADYGNGVGALVSDALVARGTSATRTALEVLQCYPAKPVALIFGSCACGLIAVIVMYLSIQRE